jgi:hypothetical protein
MSVNMASFERSRRAAASRQVIVPYRHHFTQVSSTRRSSSSPNLTSGPAAAQQILTGGVAPDFRLSRQSLILFTASWRVSKFLHLYQSTNKPRNIRLESLAYNEPSSVILREVIHEQHSLQTIYLVTRPWFALGMPCPSTITLRRSFGTTLRCMSRSIGLQRASIFDVTQIAAFAEL